MGAPRTSGELVGFLTQDATPVPGCLAADRESQALSDRVCTVFGPHLPPPETSPMIARELTEFFAGFLDGLDDSAFLSKVNASHKRAC